MYFEIDDYNALRAALKEMCLALSRELTADDVFESKLVADELLSNVLQHGGGRARFLVEREGDELRMCVKGENAYRPPEESFCADVLSERGRGLFLIDSYCVRREYDEADGIRVYLKLGKGRLR